MILIEPRRFFPGMKVYCDTPEEAVGFVHRILTVESFKFWRSVLEELDASIQRHPHLQSHHPGLPSQRGNDEEI